MGKTKESGFEHQSFSKRMRSMMKVDFRRMFTTPLFYIMTGTALVMPILILVMTTMMGGVVDPETGAEHAMGGFTNAWQAVAQISGEGSGMNMDLTTMCNINLVYFMAGIFICLFVSADFRSGYSKNLFTVRAKKTDYVFSKTLTGFAGGTYMLLAFFTGVVLGGSIAGLPFDLGSAGVGGLILCILAKICLMAVFSPIFLMMSVIAKQRTWLSIMLSLFAGMLLFMMIPMMTPLNSGIMNVLLCLAGGAMFTFGLGAFSNRILKKTSLV